MLFAFFKKNRVYYPLQLFIVLWLTTSCSLRNSSNQTLASINLLDRNGMSQTISSKDRLRQFQEMDFSTSSPYQKVMRVYERDDKGNVNACVTSYHPNGQIKQYLDVKNSRAYGVYREWFGNGQMALEALVIGGQADLDPAAQKSWLFEGHCYAWDEEGRLTADIPYSKGSLEGTALHYHPNGALWKRIPFCNDLMEGTEEVYSDTGVLLEKTVYTQGERQGLLERFWDNGHKCAEEEYEKGLLQQGTYITLNGESIGGVQAGAGFRALFNEDGSYELQQYKEGVVSGKVNQYNSKGILTRVYTLKNGVKHGEEIYYYSNRKLPKLSLSWYEGQVQGISRSWYDSGQLESQREFNNNARHGLCTAWYRDGSLMLIEEYLHDKLQKGEYHARGDSSPVSRISNGKGVCTLFDEEGNLIKKIQYQDGKPLL